jgi:hypothetical protein
VYGHEADFLNWLDAPMALTPRQLVLVGFETHPRAHGLMQHRTDATHLDSVPWLFDPMPAKVKKSSVVCVHSERFDHMQLVTSGRLLPWLLHSFR